jgi:hypothetical protein
MSKATNDRNCGRQKRRDNNEENVLDDETEELDNSDDSKRKRCLDNLERQGEETTKAVTQMAHEIARKGEEARLKEIYILRAMSDEGRDLIASLLPSLPLQGRFWLSALKCQRLRMICLTYFFGDICANMPQ